MAIPDVPESLRTPCISPPRDRLSLKDAALLVSDLVKDRDCSNGKIIAIDKILDDAEAQVQ